MSAKTLLRNTAARLLYRTGVTLPERRARDRLSIVTFHRVLPEAERASYPYPGLVVTPEELDSLLAYFTAHFDCGALATQYERYMRGSASARPLLALTFDDAQHDNYRHARPALSRHGVKASFFVPVIAVQRRELLWHDRLGFSVSSLLAQGAPATRTLERVLSGSGLTASGPASAVENIVRQSKRLSLPERLALVEALVSAAGGLEAPAYARLMTFHELTTLAFEGHEIGSHSMTHCMMTECDLEALQYELDESRRLLQIQVAQAVDTFCYPNGNCDARTAHAVARAGYRRAVTTAWGDNRRVGDPFMLRRFDMDARRMRDSFGQILPAAAAFRMSGLWRGAMQGVS